MAVVSGQKLRGLIAGGVESAFLDLLRCRCGFPEQPKDIS